MCGIVGIQSRSSVHREHLAASIAALKHRGPDGNGIFVDEKRKVGLGHARLAIIDLSPSGAQPMTSSDGRFTITYNGELYNYLDIKHELATRGCRFRGTSDTEVLLEGFAVYGPDILQKLSGIFAFAIYDNVTGDIFVARDQLGVKPLYYVRAAEGVAFASEIKALKELITFDREIDRSALRKYVTFLWCPGEQTLFESVKKLEPGSAMILRDGDVARRWIYWKAPVYDPRHDWNAQECAEELGTLVNKCVDRQMVADTPVGAFLSGGLDSSAVVAAMRRKSRNIQCFTIDAGDAEEGTTKDLPYAYEVAAHLGVDLHVVKVEPSKMASRISDMVTMLDEPLADPACLNVLYISQLAREQGIKVLLSGAGGDDIFSGYRRHTMMALDTLWSRFPASMGQGLFALAARKQGSTFRRRLTKAFDLLGRDSNSRIVSSFVWGPRGGAGRILSPELRSVTSEEETCEPLANLVSEQPESSALEKCLTLERRFFLADHNLIYTDKMGMAAGVEVRVPLLDLELVRFASQVPTEFKCRWLKPKWILKESQRRVLPQNVIDRPKTGFGAPLRRWLKNDLHGLVDDLLSPEVIKARNLFDANEVAHLRKQDEDGLCDASYTLFSVMCVELWCRNFVDSPTTPAHRSVQFV